MKTEAFENYVRTWFPDDAHVNRDRTLAVMVAGLAGEAGEVVEHVKKVMRDYDANFDIYPGAKREAALLEFGDLLHYLVRNAQNFGFTLDDIMEANVAKLNARYGRAHGCMPYIKSEHGLREDIMTGLVPPANAGELNFAISNLIGEYLVNNGLSYQHINDVIGVLECAKQELYRRVVGKYEDQKIRENGDLTVYKFLNSKED